MIGPIGDDLPSFFPIIAGIILFLTSIAFIATEFDQRNMQLRTQRAAVDIAHGIMSHGYMDTADFQRECKTIVVPLSKKNNIHFILFLVNSSAYGEPLNGSNAFISACNGSIFTSSNNSLAKIPSSATVISYPIAYRNSSDVTDVRRDTGLLVVAVWRR